MSSFPGGPTILRYPMSFGQQLQAQQQQQQQQEQEIVDYFHFLYLSLFLGEGLLLRF